MMRFALVTLDRDTCGSISTQVVTIEKARLRLGHVPLHTGDIGNFT